MYCYECSLRRAQTIAVGLCYHCSAGLCAEHAIEVSRTLTTLQLLMREVALPIKARRLLCHVCKAALEQSTRVA